MRPRPSHPSCYHTGYSLSCSEYDSLLRRSKGRCDRCREPFDKLVIEHDHRLGGNWAVRGLVCQPCNQRLRYVDSGKVRASATDRRYLTRAWHLTQASSTAKAARVRPRRSCSTCGHDSAVKPSGGLHLHWSRIPGKHNERCPGDAPPS